jgi:hypothetical protein
MATTADRTEDEGEEHRTGWEVIAKNESVVNITDALLSMPPHREFNKTELADFADVSRKSVHTHFELLEQLDLITEVEH